MAWDLADPDSTDVTGAQTPGRGLAQAVRAMRAVLCGGTAAVGIVLWILYGAGDFFATASLAVLLSQVKALVDLLASNGAVALPRRVRAQIDSRGGLVYRRRNRRLVEGHARKREKILARRVNLGSLPTKRNRHR